METPTPVNTETCPLCKSTASLIGSYPGQIDGRLFQYYHCPDCGLFFVGNARLDYKELYTLDYYAGKHGDKSVDYLDELEHLESSSRTYEYAGLLKAALRLNEQRRFRWLDYGCGHGALIPYVQKRSKIDIEGWEIGPIAALARSKGIPILETPQGPYDVITAIEVIEHHPEPLQMLQEIRSLLRPGGTLILTTGNAAKFKKRLLHWSYAQAPDVHIRFFGPETLQRAYALAGLEALDAGYFVGASDILTYKLSKGLGMKRRGILQNLAAWSPLPRFLDQKYGVSAQPWARRKEENG